MKDPFFYVIRSSDFFTRQGFYLRIASTYLKITYELNMIWIDIDRRSPITSVCGSDVTSAVYTNRSQLQDAASIWFLLEAGLIFDKTCGFYLRFMNTIWEQKTDRRLLLWIRCNAGRTQTALNYKTRLLFDLWLSDLWSIEICRRRLRSKGKSTFFTGKPVVSGFSHLLLIPIFLYVFDAQWGQTKLNSLAESFYYVNYGSSIIMSNVCWKITVMKT